MTTIPASDLLAADIQSLAEDISFYLQHDRAAAIEAIEKLEAKLARLRRELARGDLRESRRDIWEAKKASRRKPGSN